MGRFAAPRLVANRIRSRTEARSPNRSEPSGSDRRGSREDRLCAARHGWKPQRALPLQPILPFAGPCDEKRRLPIDAPPRNRHRLCQRRLQSAFGVGSGEYTPISFWCFSLAMRSLGLVSSRPIETRRTPAWRWLFNGMRDPVAQGIDLDRKPDLETLSDPQSDHPVEQRVPLPIAGEIIVVVKNRQTPVRIIFADRPFEIGSPPAASVREAP
jgi:hypothetical protein